jgi:hypothetical protein
MRVAYIRVGIAYVLNVGLTQIGLEISHRHPIEFFEILKVTRFQPQNQELIDFIVVMLTPGVATNLADVRAIIHHAKKIMSSWRTIFQRSYSASRFLRKFLHAISSLRLRIHIW